MIAQLYEYKNYWIVYWMNCMVYELFLNKTVTKNNAQASPPLETLTFSYTVCSSILWLPLSLAHEIYHQFRTIKSGHFAKYFVPNYLI